MGVVRFVTRFSNKQWAGDSRVGCSHREIVRDEGGVVAELLELYDHGRGRGRGHIKVE